MENKIIFYLCSICLIISLTKASIDNNINVNIAVSARYRKLELVWYNIPINNDNKYLLLTDKYPEHKFFSKFLISEPSDELNSNDSSKLYKWKYFPDDQVLYYHKVDVLNGWHTTNITFDQNLLKEINSTTSCYGYWIFLVNENGNLLSEGCIKAYPRWMNNNRNSIENFRIKDLFIPGTHDSVAYRYDFKPNENETLVTKYAVTQDDDIKSQLLHGIRYLDIRVGYYKFLNTQFWGNHGISRQQPLYRIFKQIREFVHDTNEIVLVDFQEFPVGFGKGLDIHHKLIQLIEREIGDLIIKDLPWSSTLKKFWATNKNIIVSYDHTSVRNEYPNMLLSSVEHKWGNVQSLPDLKKYLTKIYSENTQVLSSRPKAAMAELTPQFWGVVKDQYGGLRVLSDQVNQFISYWYQNEWGLYANIVALDFYRGTTIIDTAINYNINKASTISYRIK